MIFPDEIMKLIARQCDLSTLFKLCATSKYMLRLIQPYIFYDYAVNYNKNIKHFDIKQITKLKNMSELTDADLLNLHNLTELNVNKNITNKGIHTI